MENLEIDALVAAKVMGINVVRVRSEDIPIGNPVCVPDRYPCMVVYLDRNGVANGSGWFSAPREYSGRSFSPTTDPGSAKQLRNKMRADGWSLEFADQRIRSTSKESCIEPEGKYKAAWWDGGCVEGAAFADTEEMAVALAALKAVEQGGRLDAAAGKEC